jgi:zinc protease
MRLWLLLLLLLQAVPARGDTPLPPWPVPGEAMLAQDPSVTWGRLPNGLRYAIMPNDTPPGHVSLRLLILAGSLMEDEQQRGLAHFTEHMAFKGSQHLAPGELISFLQRSGLAFGPDTNAQTGYDTTIYQLDLPTSDPTLLGRGLDILSEIEGRLTFDPAQIEPERGVILSEKRQREGPQQRLRDATLDFLMHGSRHAERDPIGLEQVIRSAPRSEFVRFYEDFYTPQRSIVIVTGDVDPSRVGALIEARFAGFEQPANARPDPSFGPLPTRGLDALLMSDPGLPAAITFNRVLPYDDRPDSLEVQRDLVREMLALTLLDRRFEQLGLTPGMPFRDAGIGAFDLEPAARIVMLRLMTTGNDWRKALALGEQELRRATTVGITGEELARAVAILRSQLAAAAAGASTRPSDQLAGQLIDAIVDQRVFTSPATDLALYDEIVSHLAPGDIDETLRRLWGGPPLMVLSGPIDLDSPREAILAAYRESAAQPLPEAKAALASGFAYGDFGRPSGVQHKEEISDLGITRVTFGNGVQLDFKPTRFEAGAISVGVRFGTGRFGMPADQPGLNLLAEMGFVYGGLQRHGIAELTQLLASRQAGADLVIGDTGLVLVGRTIPEDLPLQLDLLAAYLTEPGFRPELIDRYRQQLAATYAHLDADPSGVLKGEVARLVHGNDPRFGMPDLATAEQRTLAELRAWLGPMLSRGPVQVAVVGDVDPKRLIQEVGRTFGALPPRPPLERPAPPLLNPPTAELPLRFSYQGDDQALALVYWPTTGRSDARTEIGLDLVSDILDDRLLREVRVAEGATYSPQTFSNTSPTLPGFGLLGALLDVAPSEAERLVGVIRQVGGGMRGSTITDDEFERALQPRLASARTHLSENDFWFRQVLIGLPQFPERLDDARHLVENTQAQTRASVQALANRYLDPNRSLPVLVMPREHATTAVP